MKSIGQVLDESGGVGKGFDLLRITLALFVLEWHAFQLSTPALKNPQPGLFWIWSYSILVMFFALSGFLIAASAQRLNLRNFLINRGSRIFPALGVEVILSALVLGPIFTTFTLGAYFTHHSFWLYLTNLFGFVYYRLPGVFGGDWVNGSIWTVPYELGAYAIISTLIVTGLLGRKWILLAVSCTILLIEAGLVLSGWQGQTQVAHSLSDLIRHLPANAVDYVFFNRGSKLTVSFTLGTVVYLYRYRIPHSIWLFGAMAAFVVAAEFIAGWGGAAEQPMANVFLVAPMVYMTVFLGLSKLPTPALVRRGDYSYGTYLYGWPMTQAVRFTFPEHAYDWRFVCAVSLVPTLMFAVASWHLVERPILRFRNRFAIVARQRTEPQMPAAA